MGSITDIKFFGFVSESKPKCRTESESESSMEMFITQKRRSGEEPKKKKVCHKPKPKRQRPKLSSCLYPTVLLYKVHFFTFIGLILVFSCSWFGIPIAKAAVVDENTNNNSNSSSIKSVEDVELESLVPSSESGIDSDSEYLFPILTISDLDDESNNSNNNNYSTSPAFGGHKNIKQHGPTLRKGYRHQDYYEYIENWANSLMKINKNKFTSHNTSSGKYNGGAKRGSRSVCRISEFSCSKGKCISSDKYCDTINDCPDGSDEPPGCTPCNRTYYGEWGTTYSISLSSESVFGTGQHGHHKAGVSSSSSGRIPTQFVCQLTFAAAGEDFGDLVQIMFDAINIGQFTSSMVNGCNEGSLQVAEISRPITGGQWCGAGQGYSVYFSEMSAIALTLSIGDGPQNSNSSNRLVQETHQITTAVKGDRTVIASTQQPLEFEFKIRYKFIPRSHAVVRYGFHENPVERGELVPGSYCSRVLDTCHQKRCKIQTPNYPGLYPRNVTCYFTIRQREVPSCKKVLIQISQLKPHKVQLRSIPGRLAGTSNNNIGIQEPNLHDIYAWEDCTGSRDSLIIYDGTTTDDPVLLKFCGGAFIPPITSSGSEVLIAFHSTPYGNPLEPRPPAPFPSPLRGFELDVDVIVVDSLSADYSNHQNCTFYFISVKGNEGTGTNFKAQEYGGNWITGKFGVVSSPRHTVPQKTICRYEFKGSKYENVWIYFMAYRRGIIKDSKEVDGNCTTRLRILDGIDPRNEVLLGTYCDNELPRLCDHKALQNETRGVRACTVNESYISAGSRLIVEQQFLEGTGLRPLHYKFHYEFVSRHTSSDATCHRHYSSTKMALRGTIRTTDNVFDFGRGGKSNVSCSYKIYVGPHESLRLSLKNSSFGERACKTMTDIETGRYICHYMNSENRFKSEIQLREYIWSKSNLTMHHHCICGNSSGQSFHFLGRVVELLFAVEGMKSDDSYENFFGFFDYSIHKDGCSGNNHILKSESGTISLESIFHHGIRQPTCDYYPWLLEAKEGYSLYLRLPGFPMLEDRKVLKNSTLARNDTSTVSMFERTCPTTKNRILIYNQDNKLVQKVCPASTHQITSRLPPQTVEIYSEDFYRFSSPLYKSPRNQFIIDFIGRELGTYRVHWLEVMSARMKSALVAMEKDSLRMGEAARVAAGGFNGTGVDKNLSPFDDPLFKSMFENGEDEPIYTGPGDSNSIQIVSDKAKSDLAQICSYYCPELQACISPKLWCDGEVNCPISLADERNCDSFWLTVSQLMSPAVYLPILAAIISATACCLFVLFCLGIKKIITKKSERNKRQARQLPPRDLFIEPQYHDPDS